MTRSTADRGRPSRALGADHGGAGGTPEIRHRFLFEEGRWTASGSFLDADGKTHPASGNTAVVHGADGWMLDGVLNVHIEPPQSFRNTYRIGPFDSAGCASWTSVNAFFGPLEGHFVVTGETILSVFRSVDGRCRGVEALRLEANGSYAARGAFFVDGQRLSSWTMILVADIEPRKGSGNGKGG